ncbi:MAG: histidine--tRNA ligase [Cyclobacteriaceae bacterium]
MEKPTLPKGTRDFGPAQMARRLFILDTIRTVFKKYGFQPLETPAMENLSTLTGKYGEEGDQLLFRILNSGDFLKETDPAVLTEKNSKKAAAQISEKGLRYDLTVPFARYVVMNQHELAMPFRRYQIQPVWRADRPQKGRYREFYQCDADVVGTDSLLCEAEIILMIKEVFEGLGLSDYQIKINHRDVLTGLAEMAGAQGKEGAFFVALDKLDKIGEEKVKEELATKGISGAGTDRVFDLLRSNATDLQTLKSLFTGAGQKGLSDLDQVFTLSGNIPQVQFDLSLARGLSYYTGCIFEVKVPSSGIGSVCGGGRYDNLTQAFGAKEKLSGVGISFGIDRIYDVLDILNLFRPDQERGTRILLCHFDEATRSHAFRLAVQLRTSGIATEVFPDVVKIKKELEYANKKSIPFAAIIGEEEMKTETITLKDLTSGQQEKVSLQDLIKKLNG